MKGPYQTALQVAWLLAATSLVACQRTDTMADGSNSPPDPVESDTPALTSEAPRVASTAIDSPGKPLPPIDFKYELLGEPAVGQPLEIRVTSSIQADLDALNVALSGNERVQVPAAFARFRMARAAASTPMTRTITVTPLAPGTLYLDVLLQADVGGRQQSRAVTIPIRVGAESQAIAPAGTVSTDAEGQRIITLPADER